MRPWTIRARRGAPAPLALVLALALAMPAHAGPPGAVGDLYVTNDIDNTCRQYEGGTGNLVGPFFANNGAEGQLALHYGESNGRALIGHFSGGVEEYDATTGAWIKTYNAGGGTQWAGIYAPNGNVYIGDWATNDVREYDSTTGALIGVITTVEMPADMVIGPNGNLFVCAYGGPYVKEVDANTGAFVDQWPQPAIARTNDIAFLPTGEILVTCMGTNSCEVYDSAKNPIGSFTGAGWGRPHGIEISPWDGNIYAADGITGQVHVFDPVTFVELNPAFLVPAPQTKIVDPVFRPDPGPVSVDDRSWGFIRSLYR